MDTRTLLNYIESLPTEGTPDGDDKLVMLTSGVLKVVAYPDALHEHANKSTLDKITESSGEPLWDGSAWPGAPQQVQYGTELSGASITLTRANHCFKTTLFNDSDDRDLELQLADWEEGDWLVIVQFGDGQGTITPESGNVKLPDWDKTAGKGFKMYIECYNVDGGDVCFSITGGVE